MASLPDSRLPVLSQQLRNRVPTPTQRTVDLAYASQIQAEGFQPFQEQIQADMDFANKELGFAAPKQAAANTPNPANPDTDTGPSHHGHQAQKKTVKTRSPLHAQEAQQKQARRIKKKEKTVGWRPPRCANTRLWGSCSSDFCDVCTGRAQEEWERKMREERGKKIVSSPKHPAAKPKPKLRGGAPGDHDESKKMDKMYIR